MTKLLSNFQEFLDNSLKKIGDTNTQYQKKDNFSGCKQPELVSRLDRV